MLSTAYLAVLQYQFGFVYILLIAVATGVLCSLVGSIAFPLYMRSIGFPSLLPWGMAFRRERFYLDRQLGRSWFIAQYYYSSILISLEVVLIAYQRAVFNRNAVEFSRSGALVVGVSVLLLIVDYYEGRTWKAQARATKFASGLMEQQIEKAHLRATIIIVTLSAAGTLIWAYGDQVLACGAFPTLYGTKDISGVACFETSSSIPDSAAVPTSPREAKTGASIQDHDDSQRELGEIVVKMSVVAREVKTAQGAAEDAARVSTRAAQNVEQSVEAVNAAVISAQQFARSAEESKKAVEILTKAKLKVSVGAKTKADRGHERGKHKR